jgi:diguanylate cyclase (GGDEF)-like protein
MPAQRPGLWFSATTFLIFLFAVLGVFSKKIKGGGEEKYKASLFAATGLAIAGSIELTSYHWLRIAYFPLVFLASNSRFRIILAVFASVLLLEIRQLFYGNPLEEAAFLSILFISGLFSFFFASRMKGKVDSLSASLKSMGEDAMESLKKEDLMMHVASLRAGSDEEIGEVLETVKKTLVPDSVSLFLNRGGDLGLRLSTEEGVMPLGEGLIELCLNRRHPVSIGLLKEGYNPGYTKAGRISSMAAVPVMDGGFALGVLVVDSGAEAAFKDSDIEVLGLFSRQIARILKKERIYSEVERSHHGLKVLHEESAGLIASLSAEHISGKIVEGAYRIAPIKTVFMIKGKRGYEVIKALGIDVPPKMSFGLKNTLLEMAFKNKEHIYISDLKNYALPVLPFDAGHIGSAFMLPLIYKDAHMGALVLFSGETDSLTPYQIELLEVLGNQASTSLANARLHEEIEKLATTDGLTGLFNHRHFQERLNEELKRLERHPAPLSLLLIDIDFFKKVNDSYGHPAGDAVLREVAGIIKKAVREVDIPARYGGEEFAAVLIDTDRPGAKQTAERLRTKVMESAFAFEDKKLTVTVSIGLATIPHDALSKEELIERADKALYHAKKGGRNMTVSWPETRE